MNEVGGRLGICNGPGQGFAGKQSDGELESRGAVSVGVFVVNVPLTTRQLSQAPPPESQLGPPARVNGTTPGNTNSAPLLSVPTGLGLAEALSPSTLPPPS